jgi:hypothetical protein
MKRNIQKGGSTQSIIIIIVIVILIAAIFGTYKYFDSYSVKGTLTKQFLPFIHDAKLAKRVNEGAIPTSSQGNEYNINMWIYINDYVYRYSEDKIVIKRGNDDSSNPTILLTANTNTLRIITNVENNIESEDSENTDLANICDIPDIPLQRWVNINVSLNDKVVDVFINGNLVKTCIVNGYPKPNVGAMDICKDGGFNGFISNITFTNRARTIVDIQSVYRKGPSID